MLSAMCTCQCLRSQAIRAPILDGSSRLHSGTRAQFTGTSAPHARTAQTARPTHCFALAMNWLAADVMRRARFCVGVQAAGQFRGIALEIACATTCPVNRKPLDIASLQSSHYMCHTNISLRRYVLAGQFKIQTDIFICTWTVMPSAIRTRTVDGRRRFSLSH